MLSEEGLLLVACLAAVALAVIALLEVLWPSRRPHPRARTGSRRGRGERWREGRPAYGRRVPGPREALLRPAPPAPRRVEEVSRPTADRPGESAFTRAATPIPEPSLPVDAAPEAAAEPPPTASPVSAPADPATAPAAAPPASGAADLPVEQCFALYQDQRYADVIALAEPALEPYTEPAELTPGRAHEVAALLSVTGLSKQALDDEDGARAAFEKAIGAAPDSERPTYQRHLALLGLTVARRLLVRAEALSETAGGERAGALSNAARWLRQALAGAREDASLREALEEARAQLWDAYAQLATALIQRQEFHRARRALREALAEEGFPEDRRDRFGDLLAATFSGEIGHLTAHAIRVMQDEHEREALASLERAEALLASIPAETLSPKRRDEVNRRLRWGYTRLGARRVACGAYEDAVEPLFHALRLSDADQEQRQEARAALVQALDGVTAARVESIDQLLKAGDRDGAAREGDRLRKLLLEGIELGLSQTELRSALTRSRRVLERVEPGP